MDFSAATLHATWQLARGQCECQREGHGHAGRCGLPLVEQAHGCLGEGGWFAFAWRPLARGGRDDSTNAEALCKACYERAAANPRPGWAAGSGDRYGTTWIGTTASPRCASTGETSRWRTAPRNCSPTGHLDGPAIPQRDPSLAPQPRYIRQRL